MKTKKMKIILETINLIQESILIKNIKNLVSKKSSLYKKVNKEMNKINLTIDAKINKLKAIINIVEKPKRVTTWNLYP